MGEKKRTVMVIKVDLGCEKCRRKIKKILCDIPQVQNQVYDEKTNTVTITVYCCCPEKIMKKICCKGGKTVKAIEIKPPEKPKEPEKPKQPEKPKEPEKPKQPEKPKEPEKPKQPEKPKEPEKPKQPEKPKEPEKPKQPEKPKEPEKPKQPEKPKEPEKPKQPPPPVQVPCVPGYPPPAVRPTCCRECYEGYGGGPCYEGYGRPVPCYEGYGRPVYDTWGGGCGPYGRGCYVSRCDYYLSEENPRGCIIM